MMDCPVCKKELLLIEVSITRSVELTPVLGLYEGEIDLGEGDIDEILDAEVTHYECSSCGDKYYMDQEEMTQWLEENPEYQDWGEREEE